MLSVNLTLNLRKHVDKEWTNIIVILSGALSGSLGLNIYLVRFVVKQLREAQKETLKLAEAHHEQTEEIISKLLSRP